MTQLPDNLRVPLKARLHRSSSSTSYTSRDAHIQALSWRRLFLAKAKLKQASNTSALLAGFAMVAMVEATIDAKVPQALLITFSVSTTLVVVVHLLAVMISTCLLPDIEAVSQAEPDQVKHSPHDQVKWYVEVAWLFSTGLGIFLFLAQMSVIAWVRFYLYSFPAAIASMVVIAPAIVAFAVFSVRFSHRLIKLKYKRSSKEIRRVEAMAQEIDDFNNEQFHVPEIKVVPV